MRKKWLIIAAVVFLGVACGVMILNRQSHYSSESFFGEMSKQGEFYLVAHMDSAKMNPTAIESAINWFHTFIENRKINAREYAYRRSGSEYFSLIIIYEKNNQIYEVKIKPNPASLQDSLDTQSDLAKTFPKLPCKIITSP